MANDDENVISRWAKDLEAARPLRVIVTGDSRSERFREFGEWFASLAPAVRVHTDSGEAEEVPELRIQPNISYQAIPLGYELKPFLQTLADEGETGEAFQFSDTQVLEKLAMPAVLKLYISPHCPFCPQAVKSLAMLAAQQKMIHLKVIDAVMFSEKAKADGVSSVPTVFLDDQFRWTGSVQLPEIIDVMLNRDPSQLSGETLKQILYDGKASELARMMADYGKVFPGLYELLTNTMWPVRLGAMVTMEYLAGLRSDLTAEVIEELWRRFDQVEDAVKGDILYLFGETRPENAREKLEAVIRGDYAQMVKDSASDALTAF